MSAWQNIQAIYTNSEDPDKFSLIIGEFDGRKALGIHWSIYGAKAPMLVDDQVRNIILSGLLQQAMMENSDVSSIIKAIQFFEGEA